MKPFDAPSGTVWEYTFNGGRGTPRQFIMLDGFAGVGERRVLWLYDQPTVGHIVLGSRINDHAVRLS